MYMHKTNKMWFSECRKKYPLYFCGNIMVAEFGSMYINGSVRECFGNVKRYIGIDWKPGRNVDVVSLAHKFKSSDKFDTIISASMLEHDPYWDLSLENMIKHMKDDAILLLSWQSFNSPQHNLTSAPDGVYHRYKSEMVVDKISELGIYVHEFHYEKNLFPNYACKVLGFGPVVLIGFKNKNLAVGPRSIDNYVNEDRLFIDS